MDFHNLCQKIDMDSIRAKLPSMPALPAAITQIKLPKSLPKLKSRKIFRSSREDISRSSTKRIHEPIGAQQQQQQYVPPPRSADFINRTPTRISTISSLMQQHTVERREHANSYRSADSIDEDYPSPTQQYKPRRHSSRPLSPTFNNQLAPINAVYSPRATSPGENTAKNAASNENVRVSFTEKLQKGYKDITEFRLKHIFAKKTVVRKDNIVVDNYVQSYEDDRRREQEEQERRDRKIAENYRFNFKVSRQNTGHTDSITSRESPVSEPEGRERQRKGVKSVGELSGDESGMETTPPVRRSSGIAATRFAKVRNPPLRQSMSEESNPAENGDGDDVGPNACALWSIKGNRTPVEVNSEPEQEPAAGKTKAGYKERLRRLTNYMSSHDDSGAESGKEGAESGKEGVASTSTGGKVFNKLRNFGRGAGANTQDEETKDEKKRKNASLSPQESDDEETAKTKKSPTKTEKIAARLRRFKSREDSMDNISPEKKEPTAEKSPMRTAITNKLQTWKKSFKRRAPENADESSPEKPEKHSDTLIGKLKHIRSRKNPNSDENLDDIDEAEKTNETSGGKVVTSFEAKFEQARQRTLKKVNEKMQQIKFFHKSQERVDKESEQKQQRRYESDDEADEEDSETREKQKETAAANLPPTIARRIRNSAPYDNVEADEIEEIRNIQRDYATQRARTAWTSKPPLLSESMESEVSDCEFPRVLIHQDNSDLYESTLIIAVTRPAPSPVSASPRITEIPLEAEEKCTEETRHLSKSPVEWVSNKEIISGFLQITPPTKRKLSAEAVLPPLPKELPPSLPVATNQRSHARKLSIDSNSDSDSWTTENVRSKPQIPPTKEMMGPRRISVAGLNCIDEHEEAWKVQSKSRDVKLYKTKSIDIFDVNAKKGGVQMAFEDFDDELKNEPVLKIANENYTSSFEKDSSEDPDAADDDNSSRITKILAESTTIEGEIVETNVQEIEQVMIPNISRPTAMQQIGNSRESLIANFDENDELYTDNEDYDDRPPSAAPSPPPSRSPPPPPLPERKPSILLTKKIETVIEEQMIELPPLPKTKPPPPSIAASVAKPPPQIPERTASMTRLAKPLVKTSSLRLAYNEQVKPADVGKVNKLISRFEQPQTQVQRRPRIIPRRNMHDDEDTDDSEDYSDEEDGYTIKELTHLNDNEKSKHIADNRGERDLTPTPTNTPKIKAARCDMAAATVTPPAAPRRATAITITTVANEVKYKEYEVVTQTASAARDMENNIENKSLHYVAPMKLSLLHNNEQRNNNNLSRPASEYGSPLEYPSSLIGSTETTPIPERRQSNQQHLQDMRATRSRRSMTREDEHFLSFDSDEENSYYSISSSGSNRYIVEI